MGEEYEIRIITEDEALKEKPLEPETPKKAAAAPAPKVAEEQKTNLNPDIPLTPLSSAAITGLPMPQRWQLRNLG